MNENEVHYNPWVAPPFFCKLTLQDNSVIEIEGSGELTQAMVSNVYKGTLVSAEIGTLCTSIGGGAFYNCSSLTSVTIPDSVTSIDEMAFNACSGLTSITIPDSVISIGSSAFGGCSSLTSVTIGSGVTSIGGYAFQACISLTSVTVQATTPPTAGNSIFYSTYNHQIYVPSQSVEAYKAASGWSGYASRIQAIP